jgi:hypothetical protein
LRGFPTWLNVNPQDTPLQAEIDQTKPAIALIMLGTCDIQLKNLSQYKSNLVTIAQTLLSEGIIPVLSTIPEVEIADPTLPGAMNEYNQTIADVADSLTIPLLNLWVGLNPLPSMGVGSDLVHLTVSPNGSGQMDAANIVYGMNYRNLVSLATLNKLVNIVEQNGTPDPTPPYVPGSVAPPAYINAIYQSVLGRAADEAGLAQFELQFSAGVAAQVIIQEVWLSPEHRKMEISQDYTTYLHRAVDTDGLAWWTQQFDNGLTENQVKESILSSTEFADTHASDAIFVQGVFQGVLNRQAGESEVDEWVGFLQSGHSESELCQALVQSPEAQQLLIDGYYEHYLGRIADEGGEQAGLALLTNSTSGDLPVVVMLLSSAEFLARI